MKRPNASGYDADPRYIRLLLDELAGYGWPRRRVCEALGVSYRTFTDYLNGSTKWTYTTQFAVECLRDFAREVFLSQPSQEILDTTARLA